MEAQVPKSLKILVLKNRAFGDAVIGLSSISYIKSVFSNAHVTFGLQKWIHPLFAKSTSSVDALLDIDLKSIRDWIRLFFQMRACKFDLIIELHQTGRTAKFFKLYSLVFGTPFYFHNHHTHEGNTAYDGQRKPNIQRDLDGVWSALEHLGVANHHQLPHYLSIPPALQIPGVGPRPNRIILGVIAGRATKMWPLSYYKELCEKLLKLNPDFDLRIPLSDLPPDRKIMQEIKQLNFPQQVSIEVVPLIDLPSLVQNSSLYIGNDTGLKHLCVAQGVSTFTFFGPEEAKEWHPYDTRKHKYFYIDPLECRTKTSHFCAIETCDNHLCLNQFMPEEVISYLQDEKMLIL